MKSIFRLLSIVLIGMISLSVFAVDGDLEQKPQEEIQKFMDVDLEKSTEVSLEFNSTSTNLYFKDIYFFIQNTKSKINPHNYLNQENRFRCSFEIKKLKEPSKSKHYIHIDPGWLVIFS